MLLAYVDDSGSHVGERRLFLAGYVLPEDRWRSFDADWISALESGKALSSLHMTQSFSGWTHDERAEKLRQLAQVIQRYRPMSIECSLSARDFKEIVEPNSPYDLRHPYFSCFYALIVNTARILHQLKIQGPVNFVFDTQGNVGTEAAIWYEPMRQMQAEHIQALMGAVPIFQKDDNNPGLQAADMLVWFRRMLSESLCTEEQREFADSIVFRHGVVEIPRGMLDSWAARFAEMPGIERTKGKKGSIHKTVSRVLASAPREAALSIMEEFDRIGKRSRRIENFLARMGLQRVWKWYSKRPIKLR